MTDTIPAFSPGCFGSALAFQPDHSICSGCIFNAECEPMSRSNLLALRAHLGVTGDLAKKDVATKTILDDTGELALPKKTQELVDKLDRSNLNIVEKMQRGENPFVGLLPYMRIAAHLLINLPRPLSRDTLAIAFVSKLNWQEGTAQAHARMAMQALRHIGAVDELDGAISIRRIA